MPTGICGLFWDVPENFSCPSFRGWTTAQRRGSRSPGQGSGSCPVISPFPHSPRHLSERQSAWPHPVWRSALGLFNHTSTCRPAGSTCGDALPSSPSALPGLGISAYWDAISASLLMSSSPWEQASPPRTPPPILLISAEEKTSDPKFLG